MNHSRKYNNLEAAINSELSKHEIDFEKLFYLRSIQNQLLQNQSSLVNIHREPPPSTVYYLQISDIEQIGLNRLIVRFLRVKANENPFTDQNQYLVYWCEFGANGGFSTDKEKTIIWGGQYLQICFIDVDIKQTQKSLQTLLN